MAGVNHDTAVEIARRALQVFESSPATVWHVRRLDRPNDAYYLIVFGESQAADGVAAIDEESGALRASARLSGRASPITIDDLRARELAGVPPHADAEMVWCPCQASQSPLYPFWQIRIQGSSVFVNQQGRVFTELTRVGPGGSPHA
jgi:hypothetical protein